MPSQPSALSKQQLDAIDKCLKYLLWETDARCVLLASTSGQLISELGSFQQVNTAVLSALAAGEMAATKEMANLVGEPARFRMVLHEGQRNSVYLSEVGEEMLLMTVFDTQTPIGMVRLFTREVVDDLLGILKNPAYVTPTQEEEMAEGLDKLEHRILDELDAALAGDWTEE